MSTPALLAAAILQSIALSASAQAAPERCADYTKPKVAHVLLTPRSHSLVYDATITESPYNAGDVVPAESPVMRLIAPAIQERITSSGNRITDDRLRLGDIERIAEVNRQELETYRPIGQASMSTDLRRRVLRSDDIDALNADIARLTEEQRVLGKVARTNEGRFARAIYLLSDPPRTGEIAKAGSPVFNYAYLDGLSVALHADDLQGTAPARSLAIRLESGCVIAHYVNSTTDRIGTGSELIYRASIDPRFEQALVALYRTPRTTIGVFQQ